jgi:hypothetical protein
VSSPHFESSNLIQIFTTRYFEDYFSVFRKKGKKIKSFNLESLFDKVMMSERLQSELKDNNGNRKAVVN